MLDFKVSFFLSDHTEPGHAYTLVLPDSHLWTQEERRHWAETLDPSRVVALRVPAGSAVLWRNQIMHAVVSKSNPQFWSDTGVSRRPGRV